MLTSNIHGPDISQKFDSQMCLSSLTIAHNYVYINSTCLDQAAQLHHTKTAAQPAVVRAPQPADAAIPQLGTPPDAVHAVVADVAPPGVALPRCCI